MWLLDQGWSLWIGVILLAFVRPLFVVSVAAGLLLDPGPLRAAGFAIAAYSCVIYWLHRWWSSELTETIRLPLFLVAVGLLVASPFT
jgi:hypothetical protein